MLSLKNPKDKDYYKYKREMAIISLIKKYKWSIPAEYKEQLNISNNEIAYFRGGLLTPRKYRD